MKLQKNIILLTFSFALTACASNSSTVTADLGSESDVAQKPTKMTKICKESIPTGTRIAKKTCRTKEAWDEIARVAQQRLDDSTKPQTNNPKGE